MAKIKAKKNTASVTAFIETVADASDTFGSLPALTKEEYEYYMNLPDPRTSSEAK